MEPWQCAAHSNPAEKSWTTFRLRRWLGLRERTAARPPQAWRELQSPRPRSTRPAADSIVWTSASRFTHIRENELRNGVTGMFLRSPHGLVLRASPIESTSGIRQWLIVVFITLQFYVATSVRKLTVNAAYSCVSNVKLSVRSLGTSMTNLPFICRHLKSISVSSETMPLARNCHLYLSPPPVLIERKILYILAVEESRPHRPTAVSAQGEGEAPSLFQLTHAPFSEA